LPGSVGFCLGLVTLDYILPPASAAEEETAMTEEPPMMEATPGISEYRRWTDAAEPSCSAAQHRGNCGPTASGDPVRSSLRRQARSVGVRGRRTERRPAERL